MNHDTPTQRVILVDDDPAVTHAVQFSFDLEGLDVRSFRDGESLLAVSDLPETGCMILDHNLPGMDGLTLARRIQERDPDIALVMVTGTTNVESVIAARTSGEDPPVATQFAQILGDDRCHDAHSVRSAMCVR